MYPRSLFTKIFLWFWLAIILVASAAVVSVHVLLDPERAGARLFAEGIQAKQGRMVVEILENSGPAALQEYLGRWNRHMGFRSFLFNDQGKEMSGEPVPTLLAQLAVRAQHSGEVEIQLSDESMFIATRIPGADESRYVYVYEMPHWPHGPPHPPGPPGQQDAPGQPGPRKRHGPLGFLLAHPETMVLVLGAVVITGAALCYWLTRYLTVPMKRLRAATRKLAEGDLTVRVGASVSRRRDEIGDLGRDFNHMAERIDSLMSTERRLLRDVSHELRSPLARVNVALGIARQHAGPQEIGPLDRIERETERLNALIGQLLTLVHLESGTDRVQRDTIDLVHLVQEVTQDADYEARSRHCRVRLVSAEPSVTNGSREMLRRAFENVMRNAVCYTAEATEVEVALRRVGGAQDASAIITVCDHGKGIPEAALSDVFRPFYRVEDGRERQTGGIGLGLAITQRAVRAHGGTVRASNAPGGGLIVEIQLPLVKEKL